MAIHTLVLLGLLGIFPYLLIELALLYGFKKIHDRITRYDDDAEIRQGNLAAGIARGGMYLGLVLAMNGSLLTEQLDYLSDLLWFAVDGLWAVVVMTLASFVLDKVVLPHVDNRKAVGEGNRAVAVVEAAGYIGLGVIMLASLAGGGAATLSQDFASGAVFAALGLGALVGVYGLFVLTYKMVRGHKVSDEIAGGNVAIAIEAAGVLLGMSLVLGFSIIGDFQGWAQDILAFVIAALSGVLMVAVGQVVSRRLFVRGGTLLPDDSHGGNVASASINAMLLLAIGSTVGLAIFA